MTISKSYPAVSRFLGAIFMLTLPWAAAAETIDGAITSKLNSVIDDATITITESGSITTDGILQHGIDSIGESATIINNGMITTDGGSAYGIKSTGDSATQDRTTIINNGTIITNLATSHGILADGAEATITINGTIETLGERSAGIRSTGNDAIITLGENGMITTRGEISSAGSGAPGIVATHRNAVITIDGTITTSGEAAHGVQSTNLSSDNGAPDNANITVGATGTITTGGNNAHGIQAAGDDAIITINGTVIVNGEGSYVVQGGDDTDQILNLRLGAETQGEFNLGDSEGDNDVAYVWLDAAATSSTIIIGGAETINLMSADPNARILRLPRLVSNSGDRVASIDPTGSTATRMALGATTGQIHRQVANRLAFAPQVGDSSEYADKGSVWGTLFGRLSQRDDDGLALAFDHSFYGVVGGYDAHIESDQRVGFFAGVGREDIKTSDIAFITDTADRGFAGVYGQHVVGNLSLDGSVMLGYASHRGTRDNANGKYQSTTISPALRINWSHALHHGIDLRPSAQIAYTRGFYSGYSESSTSNTNLSFGKRNVGIADARLQLALAQLFAGGHGEIEWRIGATSTYYGKDSVVGAQIGESPTTSSYEVPGDRTLYGGFIGATLRYAIKGSLSLDGTIEYSRVSGDTSGAISGQLGMMLKF